MRPVILGIGGTLRSGSTSERALGIALKAAAAAGAEVMLLGGEDLCLPMYTPAKTDAGAKARKLIDAFRRCDGLVIATPAYHGSVSGLIKNALDYSEDLRGDSRVYFDGVPVGCIVCAGGWQAAGYTLCTLRNIVHALRGWPTPLGALLDTSQTLFDEQGRCLDVRATGQLEMIGRQVTEFSLMKSQRLCLAS